MVMHRVSSSRLSNITHSKRRRLSSTGTLRSEDSDAVNRVAISYSSTLLLIWTVVVAVLTWSTGSILEIVLLLGLCLISLTSPHGESRMIMPLIFQAECCLNRSFGGATYAPLEFYASTLLSYLSLTSTLASRLMKSGTFTKQVRGNAVLTGIIYLTAFVVWLMAFAVFQDRVVLIGAAAYVVSGHLFFWKLRPLVGDNEAVLLSSVGGFYLCDVFSNNNVSADGGRETFLSLNAEGYQTSYTHIASRGMLLSAIYMATLLALLSPLCRVRQSRNSKSSELIVSRKRMTILFLTIMAMVLLVMELAISYQFKENAAVWLYHYIVGDRFRFTTLQLWLVLIPLSVTIVDVVTVNWAKIVQRKMFHFIAVIAFTPAAMVDPPFLALSLSTAASLLICVEIARYYQVYGTDWVDRYVSRHIDTREHSSGLIRSHIYLIFGLGLSLMLRYRQHSPTPRPIPAVMDLSINLIPGIIALGVVDAFAALFGSSILLSSRRALGRYLTNKFFTARANSSITHKTTTGTMGGLLTGLLFWTIVLVVAKVPIVGPVWYTYFLILVCTLTECFMDGIDNLQMPMVVVGVVYTLFTIIIRDPQLWLDPRVNLPNPTTAKSLASAFSSSHIWGN